MIFICFAALNRVPKLELSTKACLYYILEERTSDNVNMDSRCKWLLIDDSTPKYSSPIDLSTAALCDYKYICRW